MVSSVASKALADYACFTIKFSESYNYITYLHHIAFCNRQPQIVIHLIDAVLQSTFQIIYLYLRRKTRSSFQEQILVIHDIQFLSSSNLYL